MNRRRLLQMALASMGLAWSFASGQDISTAVLQNQVMAASLFRFLPYVEWPAGVLPPGAPYVIAVIGADAIADELTAVVASRTVNGRTVSVRRMKAGEPMEGMHAVFIGGAGARRLPPGARHGPVLIVTETEGALDHGSMINFRVVDGRVRFEVALDTLEEAGLKVSSRMLGVALHVRQVPSR
jgi:hypothetical protein